MVPHALEASKETSNNFRVGSEFMRVHGASRHQVDIERRVCICKRSLDRASQI